MKIRKYLFLAKTLQNILVLLLRTNRWKIHGETVLLDLLQKQASLLLCGWHGELVCTGFYLAKKRLKPWILISLHRDGEMATSLAESWGYRLLRGSSSKQASAALRSMKQLLQRPGEIICITCDGPKGPRREVKPGSLQLAQQLKIPAIGILASPSRYWQFRSWDQFRIPKPFGTIHIQITPPFAWPDIPLSRSEIQESFSTYLNDYQRICEEARD